MSYKIGQLRKIIEQDYYSYDDSNNGYTITNNPENIITELSNNYSISSLSRFGIQAKPGSLIAIGDNNDVEIIMIGRSGIYEIYTDLVEVSNIQLLSQGSYIIDFKY